MEPTNSPLPTPPKKAPNKAGIGCLGIIAFLVIFGAIGSQLPDTAENKTETASPQSAADKEFYSIGEPIQLDDHTIVVNKFKQGFKSSNMFDKPQSSSNEFVVVNVTTNNTSNEQLSVNEFGFELEDDAGVKRNPTMVAGMDNSMESAELQSGGTISGNIPFEARKGSKKLILHYAGNISSGGAKVKLK